MSNRTVIGILLLAWVATFALSFVLSLQIDGPRNMDTGFRRLDVLFKWQLTAFCIAIAAAISGFVLGKGARRLRIASLVPLTVTLILVGAIVGFALLREDPAPPPALNMPVTKPAQG